jgi:hypothetical protein
MAALMIELFTIILVPIMFAYYAAQFISFQAQGWIQAVFTLSAMFYSIYLMRNGVNKIIRGIGIIDSLRGDFDNFLRLIFTSEDVFNEKALAKNEMKK